MTKWHRIPDELPEEGQDVIFCAYNDGSVEMSIGYSREIKYGFDFQLQGFLDGMPQYWTPLPIPPEIVSKTITVEPDDQQ